MHPVKNGGITLVAMVTLVCTQNLAIGVGVGAPLLGLFFAVKIAQLFKVSASTSVDGLVRTYLVTGQLFYDLVEDFLNGFDFKNAPARMVIDVKHAHIWDISSVQPLDMVVMTLRSTGTEVNVSGMNEACETIAERLAPHDKPGVMDALTDH